MKSSAGPGVDSSSGLGLDSNSGPGVDSSSGLGEDSTSSLTCGLYPGGISTCLGLPITTGYRDLARQMDSPGAAASP